MICAFCKKDVNPLNYGRVKINDIQNIKVLDESVRTKTPRLNITLCAECNTELVTELLKRAIEDEAPKGIDTIIIDDLEEHDIATLEYIAKHPELQQQEGKDCDENCLDCPRR